MCNISGVLRSCLVHVSFLRVLVIDIVSHSTLLTLDLQTNEMGRACSTYGGG